MTHPKLDVTIPDSVHLSEVDGTLVLMDMESGRYFGLDEVGTVVWRSLERNGSLESAVESVVARYDVEAERAEEDVRKLLDRLREERLIHLEKQGS